MTVCIHGFHNDVMRCMLQVGYRIFWTWVVSMQAIFSCLNLKHDAGFLPYSMPEVFSKTGHCLTDIMIARAEFKPVLHPEFFE